MEKIVINIGCYIFLKNKKNKKKMIKKMKFK